MNSKDKTIMLSFTTSKGSVSDYFVALSNKLSEKYNIVIISQGNYVPDELKSEIEIHFWLSDRPNKLRDLFFIFRLLKKYKPVMSISLFGAVNVNLISSFICGVKYRVAWIRTLSTQFPQKKLLVFRKKIIYKLANLIITNSNATKNDASSFYDINPKKIQVLPNSVKNYFDKVESICDKQNKLVYVGRLHTSKGVDVLLMAFQKVLESNENLKLHIIGSGPASEKLKRISKKLKLVDNVFFRGVLSKEDVLKEFKSSYISIIPSNSEAFGFTVIEAMSMKTCVIGANNTGIKEIIIHNETGLLFKTGDYKGLAFQINKLYDKPEYRNKLAENGFKRYKDKYSVDVAIERDFLFFDNLIQN